MNFLNNLFTRGVEKKSESIPIGYFYINLGAHGRDRVRRVAKGR